MKIEVNKNLNPDDLSEYDILLKVLNKNDKELMANTIKLIHNQESIVKAQLTRLKDIEHEKDEFLSMISHELKTPLTPIMGWCEALKTPKILGELSSQQLEAVDTIYSNALELKHLITDLLDVQKLQLKKMQFHHLQFPLSQILDELLADFRYVIKEDKIKIIGNCEGNSIINSDKQRILQVLTNIVNNSIDFVPKGNGLIEIAIREEDDSVIFSVKDNGLGISKANQKNLFKKFYQIDTNITRKHGGTGLGLTVCKGIVEGLGGQIWVHSILNEGSTFYFSIPKNGE